MSQMKNMYCEKTKGIFGSASSATELIRESSSNLVSHINVFLYDTTMSKNGSMLTEDIGDASATNYMDIPMIVTETLGHNVFPEDPTIMPEGGIFYLVKPVTDYIKASRRFEVGRVVNVVKKYIGAGNAKAPLWIASVKLSDMKFRKFITKLADKYADIRQAKLFVSSFHVGTASQLANGKYVYDGPVQGIHIALVNSPAYDPTKSVITGICTGSDYTCAAQLAAAASYSNINQDQLLIEFNNELMAFSRSLYSSASANSIMSENDTDLNKQPVKATNEKEEPKEPSNKKESFNIEKEDYENLKKTIAELQKKLEEKKEEEKEEDKPKEPQPAKEDPNLKKALARIAELERKEKINKWLEKLKPIKGLDAKAQAALIVDKEFSDEEAEQYIKSFAPIIKASANSDPNKERSTDALLTKFELASASQFDSYDDATKKASNYNVNLGAAEFLGKFIKV